MSRDNIVWKVRAKVRKFAREHGTALSSLEPPMHCKHSVSFSYVADMAITRSPLISLPKPK